MKIARVFCAKTSYSPTDEHAYFDVPDMLTPDYDEVHISCVFTWDKDRAEYLKAQWQHKAKKVLVGGPAYSSPCDSFTPGMFVKKGVVFTSRGCPNKCSFCFVPWREGKLKELPITEGNIIQDNNFLACSEKHIDAVCEMLKKQHAIEFKGGLEARRIKYISEKLRGLRIKSLWLACDTPEALKGAVFCRLYAVCAAVQE